MSAGIPHPPGTKTKKLTVSHKGDEHTILVPHDHDGARVKVEFPDGQTAYTEGYNETERALEVTRPMLSCARCGAENALVDPSGFTCIACGIRNALKLSTDAGNGRDAGRTSKE